MNRIWVYKKGSIKNAPSQGYSVRKLLVKKEPWLSEVWLGRSIVRTDRHETREGAIKYCRQRKRQHLGGR
jgi:hypothetical protein